MSIFSTFCGLLYNDFTSIPLEIFESCYDEELLMPYCVYPLGVDHRWYQATNVLTYLNSMKMKISVILGVSQMTLGILLKALNSCYFKRYYDLYFEFIP